MKQRWFCQTKSVTSQSATIIQTYEAQILNHSIRAALRFAYKSVCFWDVFHDWSGCWYLLKISNPYE